MPRRKRSYHWSRGPSQELDSPDSRKKKSIESPRPHYRWSTDSDQWSTKKLREMEAAKKKCDARIAELEKKLKKAEKPTVMGRVLSRGGARHKSLKKLHRKRKTRRFRRTRTRTRKRC